jgi:hypothetical protein
MQVPAKPVATPVCLWHGDLDTIVRCAMTRHLAARIPQCRAAFFLPKTATIRC